MPGKRQQKTFCRICEAQCGLVVGTQDGRVTDIQPNPDHVSSKGYACIKGLKMGEFAHNPDRLTAPLKKVSGAFVEISWERALSEIGAKLREIRDRDGGQSIAAYMGNPIGFSMWPTAVLNMLLTGFGSDKLFTPGTQDCASKFAGGERLFGGASEQVFPDLDHSQCLIAIGSNPVISKMSFISAPHPMDRIKGIEQRGGKVYWVNPRRTESARRLGEHVAIRPDTDVFFLLGFLNEVIRRNAVDHERVKRYMNGYETLVEVVEPWTPDRVARVTRIPAQTLTAMVDDYLAADGAAIYSSTGTNQGSFGVMVYWLQEAINAITGNLDRRGGVLAGKGVLPTPPYPEETARSRIDNIPYVNSTIPAGIMADEILTPGEGRIRAMFNMSGNPLLTCAGSDRLAEAFEDLELFVCLDIVRNETAEYADYILPGLHSLERADIPFYFFSVMGLMPTRSFSYTDPVLAPPGQCRDEGLVFRQICRHARVPLAGSRPLQWCSNLAEWLDTWPFLRGRYAMDRLFFSIMARVSKLGGLGRLRKHPDGLLLEPNKPGDYLGQRVKTESGKVELAPADLVERASTLESAFQRELENASALKLIQKRERYTHNTWAHNVETFVKGEHSTNYLYIHPSDADDRGLADGDIARVSANGKHVDVPVKRDEDMQTGTISVPHGWGHQDAAGLSVARRTTGVNVNRIMPDGPGSLEPASGMSHMNGVLAQVARVSAA